MFVCMDLMPCASLPSNPSLSSCDAAELGHASIHCAESVLVIL